MTDTYSCPHGDLCCSKVAFSFSYAEQLQKKRARVEEVFARYPQLSPEIKPCAAASPVLEYRTRAKLAVGSKGEIGVFAPGTHKVVDLPKCVVLSASMRAVVDAVREELAAFRLIPYAPERGIGLLRGLDLRESIQEKKLHLTLVLNAQEAPLEAEEAAESLLSRVPSLAGVAANLNPAPSVQALGPQTVPLRGRQELWEKIDNAKLRYSPGTFAQAHRGQAGLLVQRVRALLKPAKEESLLDLYSGVGMFSLSMANEVKAALLVESFPKAADDAQAALKEAKLPHLTVLSGSVEDTLRELEPKKGRIAVVNPPRRGLSPDVIEALGRIAPERLVYVSCDPDTLARDTAQLALCGLRLAAPLEPVDMIPFTEEVETVAFFKKGPPPPLSILYQDEHYVAVDKPWGMSSHRGEDETDDAASRLSLQVGQKLHPVHRLDRDTSGVALYARTPEATRALHELLSSGQVEREYIALVRGITRPRGNVNRPLKEQGRTLPARTRYKRLSTPANHSLLVIDLVTGRNHQIRRHMEGLGHPIIGDDRYGHQATNRHFSERYGLVRPFLHSHRIAFIHPFTKEVLKLRSPLPGDLATLLARAGEGELADTLSTPVTK